MQLGATCLGCGCTCDDVRVVADAAQITEVQTECQLARAWFGRHQLPGVVRVDGRPATLERALNTIVSRLRDAARPVVAIGADVSCETQRAAVALADIAKARLDGLTAAHAAASVTAMQQHGRVSATLGELRRRADLVVFWGVDPQLRFPRLRSRYLTAAASLDGAARTFVAVDIGTRRGPGDCTTRVAVEPDEEVATLGRWAELLGSGRSATDAAGGLADLARAYRYVALIADGESGNDVRARLIAQALSGVARAINGVVRGGLCTLRDGGNRTGADAVLTWQTGYPLNADFSSGFPRQPAGAAPPADLVIVVGHDGSGIWSTPGSRVAIGPAVSTTDATIAIDTGVAGIHEAGLAYRMDDVPVPLHALIPGPPPAADVLAQLLAHYRVAV